MCWKYPFHTVKIFTALFKSVAFPFSFFPLSFWHRKAAAVLVGRWLRCSKENESAPCLWGWCNGEAKSAGSSKCFIPWLKRNFSQHIPIPKEHPCFPFQNNVFSTRQTIDRNQSLTGQKPSSSLPTLVYHFHRKDDFTCAESTILKER